MQLVKAETTHDRRKRKSVFLVQKWPELIMEPMKHKIPYMTKKHIQFLTIPDIRQITNKDKTRLQDKTKTNQPIPPTFVSSNQKVAFHSKQIVSTSN
jgi:ABC-type uncharacterized transport system involved in gliding motility auxiliary subunit